MPLNNSTTIYSLRQCKFDQSKLFQLLCKYGNNRKVGDLTLNYEKLDKQAKKSWLISRLITLFVISVIMISIRVFLADKLGNKSTIVTTIIVFIILLLAINAILYPEIEYNQWRYCIYEDCIELIHGIIFTKNTVIPLVRIQHIKTSQGPVNRKLGLSNIEIFTAGGSHEIPNIKKEKADEISMFLKDKVQIKIKGQDDIS